MTDEVGHLQRDKTPEAELFQRVERQRVEQYGELEKGQGTYVFTPNGRLLGANNEIRDPVRMAEMLKRARARWDQLSEEERFGPGPSPAGDPTGTEEAMATSARLEDYYPQGGLVLRVDSRDLPRGVREGLNPDRNTDFLWFKREESRAFLPPSPDVGAEQIIPKALIHRIARFNLADNVRGQTSSYDDEDVQEAELKSTVVDRSGDLVTIRLEGRASLRQQGIWGINGEHSPKTPQERGFHGELFGAAVFDLKKGEFTEFQMVAIGKRWGATTYNVRGRDAGLAPIGFAFSMTSPDKPSDHTAPANFRRYGWEFSDVFDHMKPPPKMSREEYERNVLAAARDLIARISAERAR